MAGNELTLGGPPYITLVASLPALPPLFAAKRVPISRVRLEQRLRALLPEDRALLDELEQLFVRPLADSTWSDALLVERAQHLVPRLPSPALGRVVEDIMEVLTVTAALRRRRRGEPPPAADKGWGYGRWTRIIRASWQEPGLGVERAFPWVREAAEHVDRGDAIALESVLMREFWTLTGQPRVGHDFDVTAVALYVLRHRAVERRVAFDAEIATLRFRRLVDDGLAGFAGRTAA